jgi:hypothetical protein
MIGARTVATLRPPAIFFARLYLALPGGGLQQIVDDVFHAHGGGQVIDGVNRVWGIVFWLVLLYVAYKVFKDLMQENGCSNVGVANCMGSAIKTLGTPPCLVFSLLNDEGYTAFCHADYTHTPPGVLLRWISGKPSFVCNSHYPSDGLFLVAHCQAPRRMNGLDYEPATIMTHYESDYGAADGQGTVDDQHRSGFRGQALGRAARRLRGEIIGNVGAYVCSPGAIIVIAVGPIKIEQFPPKAPACSFSRRRRILRAAPCRRIGPPAIWGRPPSRRTTSRRVFRSRISSTSSPRRPATTRYI